MINLLAVIILTLPFDECGRRLLLLRLRLLRQAEAKQSNCCCVCVYACSVGLRPAFGFLRPAPSRSPPRFSPPFFGAVGHLPLRRHESHTFSEKGALAEKSDSVRECVEKHGKLFLA